MRYMTTVGLIITLQSQIGEQPSEIRNDEIRLEWYDIFTPTTEESFSRTFSNIQKNIWESDLLMA